MRSPPWNEAENQQLVALYFRMLDAAIAGQTYNKAAMIRGAQTSEPNVLPLSARSRTAIEFKLMNCTAAHQDIRQSHTTMHDHGYRAMPNYQADLKATMKVAIEDRYFDRPVLGAQA